jgi:hypothetical protein
MKTYKLFRSYFWAVFFCLQVASQATEADLLNIVSGSLKAKEVIAYLENPASTLPQDDARRNLKPVEAFGQRFSGRAAFAESSLQSISLWCDDPRLAPSTALRLFAQVSKALSQRVANGRPIKNIPNYDDGSDVENSAMLWVDRDDIILLSIQVYPSRAGFSIQRTNRIYWLAGMGADEGEFWRKTLTKPAINGAFRSPLIDPEPSQQTPSQDKQKAPTTTPSKLGSTAPLPEASDHGKHVYTRFWIISGVVLLFAVLLVIKRRL